MYIGVRSRNPNRIKKISQNVHGFVYRQSQLGCHIRQSQHGDNLRPLHQQHEGQRAFEQ